MKRKWTAPKRCAAERCATILKLIRYTPMTAPAIMEETQLSEDTVYRWMSILEEHGIVEKRLRRGRWFEYQLSEAWGGKVKTRLEAA